MSSITYGDAYLNVDDFHNRDITGKNVKIAIFDDPIAEHDALDLVGGYACGQHLTYLGSSEHGTHCAGIATAKNLDNGQPVGVAPEAELYISRMYYRTMFDRVNSFIETIDWAIEEDIDVISMSVHLSENAFNLADGKPSSTGVPSHQRIALRNAFIKAYRNDLVIFVSAGNHNTGDAKDNIEFMELLPKMPKVVAVANLGINHDRRDSSGVGRWVDISGYGTDIQSTIRNNKYGKLTGTSMSTPQIAGYFCLYKELFSNLTNFEVLEKLYDNCVKVEGLDDFQQGRGVPKPPQELYNLALSNNAKDYFRTFTTNKMTWLETETYFKDGENWKEMEAKING